MGIDKGRMPMRTSSWTASTVLPGPGLRTGDLGGFLGEELVIAGRLKDLIIVGGSEPPSSGS